MECVICIEKFNNSKHQSVQCEFCEFTSCRKCYEKYILDNNEYANCMHCKKQWDRRSLLMKFTRKFVDQNYRIHCENILFDTEKTLLPATQPIIEELKRKEEVQKEMKNLNQQISQLCVQYRQFENSLNNSQIDTKKVFIKKCTNGDCRGFLSTQWKCGLCEHYSCPECHELKGLDKNVEHTCKKETIETVKMLTKDSKPCPGCAAMIFKIEGCNQMFCTQCKTVFDWKTCKIENGAVHNPHYFEWMRKNGKEERNPLDIQCGREIDHHFINQLNRLSRSNKFNLREYEIICRNLIHMRHVILPKFLSDHFTNNQDLRIGFLRGYISEEKFKKEIQKRTKKYNKNKELADIINTILTCTTEILYRLTNNLQNSNGKFIIIPYDIELTRLREYANSCFEETAATYKSKIFSIDKNMTID